MYGQQEQHASKDTHEHPQVPQGAGVSYVPGGHEKRQGEDNMNTVSNGGVGLAAAAGGFGGGLVSDFLRGGRGLDDRGREFGGGDWGGCRDAGNVVVTVADRGNGNGGRDALTDTVNSGFARLENNDNTNSILSSVDGVRTQLDTQRGDLFGNTRAVDRVGFDVAVAQGAIINNTDRNACDINRTVLQNRFETAQGFARTNYNMAILAKDIELRDCKNHGQTMLEIERSRGINTAEHKEILCKINEEGAKRTSELLAFQNAQERREQQAKIDALQDRLNKQELASLIAMETRRVLDNSDCQARTTREFVGVQTAGLQNMINTALPAAIPASSVPIFPGWNLGGCCR